VCVSHIIAGCKSRECLRAASPVVISADPIFQSGSTRTSRPVLQFPHHTEISGRENAEPSDGRRNGHLRAVRDKPSPPHAHSWPFRRAETSILP
jgi:hypothetical protein